MRTLRMVLCSLVASAGMLSAGSAAFGQGLVGFYVYRDAYDRGLLISNFIPETSAHELYLQGELRSGDIITRYNGWRVRSAEQVRRISDRAIPGEWLVMEFLTPRGEPFWHYVQPGGGQMAAACVEEGGTMPDLPSVSARFRVGRSRPGNGSFPPPQAWPDGPGRPNGPGRPHGPGRP